MNLSHIIKNLRVEKERLTDLLEEILEHSKYSSGPKVFQDDLRHLQHQITTKAYPLTSNISEESHCEKCKAYAWLWQNCVRRAKSAAKCVQEIACTLTDHSTTLDQQLQEVKRLVTREFYAFPKPCRHLLENRLYNLTQTVHKFRKGSSSSMLTDTLDFVLKELGSGRPDEDVEEMKSDLTPARDITEPYQYVAKELSDSLQIDLKDEVEGK